MKQVTAQDVHEAHNAAVRMDTSKIGKRIAESLVEWEEVSSEYRKLYENMATAPNTMLARPEPLTDNEMTCSACGATVYVARVSENGTYRYWYNCKVCGHGENVEQMSEPIVDYLEKREQQDTLWLADVFDGVEF